MIYILSEQCMTGLTLKTLTATTPLPSRDFNTPLYTSANSPREENTLDNE